MSDSQAEAAEDARLRLACGRVAGGARAIAEAHGLGTPEGPHERPWEAAYHRESAPVYFETLPRSYQGSVAALFNQCADTMDRRTIPGRLAADWVIVTEYLRNACAAIEECLNLDESDPRLAASDETSALDGPPPMVIRYDALARLTTLGGANRLERAARSVMHHMADSAPAVLSPAERHLLKRVSSGVPITELAAELGYSRRSMFRELARLWQELGVSNRTEGIQKAQSEGLLD